MEKPKLNLADLDVSSFPTTEPFGTSDQQLQIGTNLYTCLNDPTAQTRCFICPPITRDVGCWPVE